MPISLPTKTRANLILKLEESIYKSRIYAASRVFASSVRMDEVQACISHGSPLDQNLTAFLGEHHVATFFKSEINSMSLATYKPTSGPKPFRDVFLPDVALSVANTLVERLQTLPWSYSFYMRLPGIIAPSAILPTGSASISSTMRLATSDWLRANQDFTSVIPQTNLMTTEPAWEDDAVYVGLDIDGYASQNSQSETSIHAHDSIISLLGFCMVFGVFSKGYAWLFGDSTRTSTNILAIHKDGEERSLVESIEVDSTYHLFMNELAYTDSFETDIQSGDLYQTAFKHVRHALTKSPDKRLSNAAKWFFDSHVGSNAQVKFVQVMIAFEILLGDEKMARETGLSLLMANRCAYMIGADSNARKKILEAFLKGYSIRSRIVHAGISRLTHDETMTFQYMQALCAEVIKHEVKAL